MPDKTRAARRAALDRDRSHVATLSSLARLLHEILLVLEDIRDQGQPQKEAAPPKKSKPTRRRRAVKSVRGGG